ncbi:MAG: MBL fold metallo-hydrolase [Planctomycetia bacterium]|nr:MBL fold metallo-hydrolase [Planctomycetia bacterium]
MDSVQRSLACLAVALAAVVLPACRPAQQGGVGSTAPDADVAPATRAANERASRSVAAADGARALEAARRGFIAAPTGQIKDPAGTVIWDFDAFDFVTADPPATVNPGLWQQAIRNNQVGLFEVTDRIWQLRGFDLANMTLIEGDTGWIVVDALTCRETAASALAFARRHLGDKPVSAVIFTHSHVDHFGGVLGVISAAEAKDRQVPIVAPAGFIAEATSENILAGTAMGRRAAYMFGDRLPRGPRGLVDVGLGKAVAAGRIGILPPTVVVAEPTEERVIDGVRIVFHNVPETEAPSEFVFALPDLGAFCGAELMSHTLHNLYTLRGAKVRDALRWADQLDRCLEHVGDAEVLVMQHHWPVWGRDEIREFIVAQRDAYKFIHDQTVRMINAGLTGPEIAARLEMPRSLRDHMSVHGYYGTVKHNARAVYQFYMGWFDAHPSSLDELPAEERAARYAALVDGVDGLVTAAQKAYDAGDFQWAAELLEHAVHAEPGHAAAKELLARTFEQLGWAAESAAWRNFYLTGALELRDGHPREGRSLESVQDMLQHAPVERFLERMAASIDGRAAAGSRLRVNFVFTDLGESYVLWIENAVLHFRRAPPDAAADATLTLTKPLFLRLMTGQAGARDLLFSGDAAVAGSAVDLGRFLLLIERAPGTFPIVTP